MCLSAITMNVKKVNAKDDISNYIISGSGTKTDPYVLSSDCPYKEKFDDMAREVVQPTVSPLVDFSGTLTGEKRYDQYNGGVWRYTSGGPSTSSMVL